eukprot:CAMPEP_0119548056 /NCGR_PEP_ID=MMETSP1352-20130426/2075_1 /TAXON_ID=265584 /ORGANISM="Stauroneis constricta, Strain CCMP1120" /LENGTH=92 /DNA_ID=CAMNT_0007593225 /DNA_START=25 /DNA_END=299 /DNA_ORIENTATION=+
MTCHGGGGDDGVDCVSANVDQVDVNGWTMNCTAKQSKAKAYSTYPTRHTHHRHHNHPILPNNTHSKHLMDMYAHSFTHLKTHAVAPNLPRLL